MSKRATFFAVGVIGAGACTAAVALSQWSSASPVEFLLCLGLALLGATFKVPVPGMTGTISPSVVPVLYAAGKMSWQEAVVIAAIAGLTQCIWRPKRKPTKVQILFNGANLALACGVAHAVSHQVAGRAPLLMFVVAAIVYHIVDTLNVATVLSLLEGACLRPIWRNCHLWSFPYFLVAGGFAAVWARANVPASFSVAVMCAGTLYLMSTFYQEFVARTR